MAHDDDDDDSNDKRRHERVPVEMWVEEQQGNTRYFQRAGNLSAGGLYLEGTIPHPKGTFVELRFTLPGDKDAIAVKGEIVGSPDPERLGMHVRFVDLDEKPAIAARIRAFVDERA